MRKLVGLLTAVITLQFPHVARAQTFLDPAIPFNINRGPNVGVADRAHPEFDPVGIPAGAFLVFPKIGFGTDYTSNVFGSTHNPTSDAYFTVAPAVAVRSQWSRNSLEFDSSGTLKRFADQTIRNENGYSFNLQGHLDAFESGGVDGRLAYLKTYEEQSSGTFPVNAIGLVPYTQKTASILAANAFGRFRLTATADVNDFNFDSTTGLGGERLDENFRDHAIVRGSGRIEYALSPSTAAFVQVTYQLTDYHNRNLAGGDRNSHELRTLAGFTFDATDVIRASVGLGYVHRNYSNPLYNAYGDVAADMRVEYFVTQLTTITLSARRLIQDAILQRSSSYDATIGGARVDHELLRNVVLHASGEYERDGYKQVTRTDGLYRMNAGAVYKLNPRWKVTGDYYYINRSSKGNPLGADFDEHRLLLMLTYQI